MRGVAACVLSLLVLSGAGGCSATRFSARPAPVAPSPTRHVLPNGIPVVVQEHRGSELAALQLWVRAGARDEAAGELGLAHYLEHMLFRGTTSRPTGFIEREVEGVGGVMNAGTSWDYTYYYVTLPPSRVTQGLELLADISMNAALDTTVLDKEKEVVLEEMRRGQDSPRRLLGRTLYSQLFEGHPYGREIIGTSNLIRGLTRETLSGFYRRHYVPEAFAVVVVGPVNTEQVLATARATFGRLPRSGASRLPLASPAPFRPQRVDIARDGGHAYLGLAWPASRLDHADTPALELRDRRGLAYSVGMLTTARTGPALVAAYLGTAPPNADAALAGVLGEVDRVRAQAVEERELSRAKAYVLGNLAMDRRTSARQAWYLAFHELIGVGWDWPRGFARAVDAVTADDLARVAQRYLVRPTVIVLRPPKEPAR